MSAPIDQAEVARAKLTQAEQAFLLFLPADGGWALSGGFIEMLGVNALRGFGRSGLIDGEYRGRTRHRLPPLGLAVRNLLEEQQGEGER